MLLNQMNSRAQSFDEKLSDVSHPSSLISCIIHSAVPDKLFHIHEPDEDELSAIDHKMNKSSCKNNNDEDEYWWNRVNLTVLDLSSNSLASISSEIKNLSDLVTLNVSKSCN